ncbi:DUF3168 domain-containing protein [Roseovarius aestuariivivens]|uniref:DUF3168 domain-containing protein n=1 Tax=Roseovarius aestuariivivens TaxID=1888910 RepID=UPI00108211E1|nr:DUF3168 domain-containing protein [Roseovarius aestuariivivens]
MSYGAAAALQEAIYQRLVNDTTLDALVQGAIYDALPRGSVPDLYVTLGPEEARVRSDKTGGGAWHRFTVSVISSAAGFHTAKEVAAAISDALTDAPLALSRGQCPALHFFRARARRDGTGDLRRIDLTFRARVDDTPIS